MNLPVPNTANPFLRNVLSHSGATAVGQGIQLMLIIVLARLLSMENFAGYVTAVAIVAVAEMASDFGIRIWATREFALAEVPGQIMQRTLVSKLFFSLLTVLIAFLLPIHGLTSIQIGLSLLIAFTQPGTDPFLWYFISKERLDIEAGVVLAWRVGLALLLIGFALAGMDLTLLLGIWLVMNFLRMIIASRLALVRSFFANVHLTFQFSHLKIIPLVFPIGIAFLLMTLYQRLGVFGLGILGQAKDIAIYGAAFTLVASSGFLATSIVLALFPKLVHAIENGDTGASRNIIIKKLLLITWIMVLLCLVGSLVSPIVLPMLFGKAYVLSGLVMVLLLPALYISSVNFAFKYTLNALGLNWADTFSVGAGMAAFLIFLFTFKLLPLPETAALAWGLGELSIFFIKWFALSRSKKVPELPFIRILLVQGALFLVAIGSYTYFHRVLG